MPDPAPAYNLRQTTFTKFRTPTAYAAMPTWSNVVRLCFSEAVQQLNPAHIFAECCVLQSKHRTLDPEEADFFYCAVYVNVFVWPVFGWADAPWYHAPFGTFLQNAVDSTNAWSTLKCRQPTCLRWLQDHQTPTLKCWSPCGHQPPECRRWLQGRG